MRAIEKVMADPSLHSPDLGANAIRRQVTDAVVTAIQGDNA
jgi:tartrate dehydrogenase/decarboxylase/D-malate dehydrogenase